MKLTVFLILLSFVQLLANNSYAQKTKLSVDLKNTSIEMVLLDIENQSNFKFIYNREKVDVDSRVSLQLKDKSINETLDALFEGKNVSYTFYGNQVILTNKQVILTNKSESESAPSIQQESISGKVTDSSGQPLPGVTIAIKGTTKGTISDAEGSYSVSNVPSNGILIFSFVGMKTQEIPVKAKTTINVVMVEDAIGIEEVVAVGYGTMAKKDLTGAISTVKGERLTVTSQASTVNTLAGNIPGLITRQTSGEPGKDAGSLNIRGLGTALIIVDGIERSLQEFNTYDTQEIESVSVLKDASAAIYGARAGNGVILVTTKRGNTGKPVFQLNSSYSLQQTTKYAESLSAGEYAELTNEYEINREVPEELRRFTPEDIQKYYDGSDPIYHPSTDWFGLCLQKYSPQYQHNLSMRGGNESIRYYGLIGTMYQEEFFKSKDGKLNRYNIRSNIDADITDDLSASLDISYINRDLVNPGQMTINSYFWEIYASQPVTHAFYPDPTKIPNTVNPNNPIIESEIDLGGYRKEKSSNTSFTGTINYKFPFIKGLETKLFANYREVYGRTKAWHPTLDVYNYDFENDIYTKAGSTGLTKLQQSYNFNRMWTGQLYLNFNRTFKKHKVSAMALYEIIDHWNESMSGSRQNYLSTAIDYLFAGGAEEQAVTGLASEFGRSSLVGRFNYSYAGKYLLQLTARYDASPKFAPDNRWGFFPSVSAGWRISEESFLKNSSVIDNLKIRASYSNTGYDATGNFQYLTGYKFYGKSYMLGGAPVIGLIPTGLANEDIFWEDMTTYNVGVDYGLFNNKLYGEIDAFYRLKEGMLATRAVSLPNTFGATLPAENLNSLNNRGFEFKVGTQGNVGELKYNVEGHVSWARAKWVHFDEPDYVDPDDIRIRTITGKWTNEAWGYISDGLFTSQEEIDNYPVNLDNKGNTTKRPGDIKWLDVNGDSILSWKDQVKIGIGPEPEIMLGSTFQLQYKGFDLYILFQGAARTQVQLPIGRFASDRPSKALLKQDNRWTPENNKADAPIPRLGGQGNNYAGDFWLKDASYVRLKNLNIGYTLPAKLIKPIGIKSLRFYVSGTNLLTFSKFLKWEYDPETSGAAEEGYYYPQQKLFTLGVNLSF